MTSSSMLASKDSHFVKALDLADDFLELHSKLAVALKAASFELVQARYAMGPGSVGEAQYPASMTASKVIRVETDEQGLVTYTTQQASRRSVTNAGSDYHKEAGTSTSSKSQGAGETAVSERMNNAASVLTEAHPVESLLRDFEERFGCSATGTFSDDPDRICAAKADWPVQWFGALPSKHIRSAQARFQEVLEMVMLLARTGTALQNAITQFDACSAQS